MRVRERYRLGLQPLFVFRPQAAPAVPEGPWLGAADAGHENVQMRVPAGADAERRRAIGNAAVDERQQNLVAPLGPLEGHLPRSAEDETELARWIAPDDPALLAMLPAEARRPLAGRIGQLVVAPDELEGRARLHPHRSCRQPSPPQLA